MTELQVDLDQIERSAPDPELAALLDPTDGPSPTGMPGTDGRLVRTVVPAAVVVGTSGGSGTTTTAWGLAAAVAERGLDAVAVDATPFGNDLAERGCDLAAPISTLQRWLDDPAPGLPSRMRAFTGESSTGARILDRSADPLPRWETFVSAHRHLGDAGMTPVYDGGGSLRSRLIGPLLADPRIGLVVTVAARADAVARLRPAMTWLDEQYSTFAVSQVVIAVTRQSPTAPDAAALLTRGLGPWLRAVVDIPYDAHLATGTKIIWDELAPDTQQAYQRLLAELQ
ncbi:hypothetical protein ACFVVM_32910 [Nocardia sp. NPDC058176]|uniref:nucleotide-binding protein n=1 Tax=Nocardia sp. NPDC058176 TaxID=3346368 RepID=UPI0036D78252